MADSTARLCRKLQELDLEYYNHILGAGNASSSSELKKGPKPDPRPQPTEAIQNTALKKKPGKSEAIQKAALKENKHGKSEPIQKTALKKKKPGKSEGIENAMKEKKSGKSEANQNTSSEEKKPGKSEAIQKAVLKENKPGKSEANQNTALEEKKPGKCEAVQNAVFEQKKSGKSEAIQNAASDEKKPGKCEAVQNATLEKKDSGKCEAIQNAALKEKKPGKCEAIQNAALKEKKPGKCEVCNEPSELFCKNCCLAFYCCRDHQKTAWKRHKPKCYPVRRIDQRSEVKEPGELVASRDISQGEVFLKESPILIYPHSSALTSTVCIECCNPIFRQQDVVPCSECGWALCSDSCQIMIDGHHKKNECRLPFFKKQIRSGYLCISDAMFKSKIVDKYLAVGLLRALLLKVKNPDHWELIQKMDSVRVKVTNDDDETFDLKVFTFLVQSSCRMTDYDRNTINHVLGVLEGNSVDIADQFTMFLPEKFPECKSASALFPLSLQTGRNCVPNAHFSVNGQNTRSFQLQMIANVPIAKGSSVSISAEKELLPTFKRRAAKQRFRRDCHCARCKDPTELGTYVSALKCKKCGDTGYYLQTNPSQEDSPWKCIACDRKLDHRDAVSIVEEIFKTLEFEMLGFEKDPTVRRIKNTQDRLNELKKKRLHPNHFLIINAELAVCNQMFQMLSTTKKHGEHFATARKEDLMMDWSKHILLVADVLSPGYSRLRGHALFFLQFAMTNNLARTPGFVGVPHYFSEEKFLSTQGTHHLRHYKETKKRINTKEAVERRRKGQLEECKKVQAEAKGIFQVEPEDSKEYQWLCLMNYSLDFLQNTQLLK